jgi:hypothetical protein
MNGQAIAAHAIGEASLRRLASDISGPRPGGVREAEAKLLSAESRTTRASRP